MIFRIVTRKQNGNPGRESDKKEKESNTIKEIIKANKAFSKAFATKGQRGDESQ